MITRRRTASDTAEWPAANPHAAALVSARVVARVVRRLEDAMTGLDLTGRVGARAAGVVVRRERAD